MIAVDWGTSNFRAFRLDEHGAVLERRSSAHGILGVEEGNFAKTLRSEIGPWLRQGEKHVLLCGMVGSRQGWVETEYLPCPVGLSELAGAVMTLPFSGAEVRLVPGVIGPDAAAVPELMRGEETGAMGVMETFTSATLACFPGTHAKWIRLKLRKIEGFTTFMTGEMYAAVSKSTILQRMMASSKVVDQAAFLDGVARSGDSGGLLHHLFGVRTLGLTGRLREELAASYLSGLLIGHEVRAALPADSMVHLAGAPALCGLYAWAIAACGGAATIAEDAAAHGLAAIGRSVQWT